jgi:general secretion pathway protein I
MSLKRSAQQGFTLLEMLVALAVFSLAALALIRLQSVTIRTAADLDGKTLARMVASNLMVELQTDPVAPTIGDTQGEAENAGRKWRWTRHVSHTDDERLLRVDLTVAGEGAAGAANQTLSFLRSAE